MPASLSPLDPALLDAIDEAIDWHCRLNRAETTAEDWLAFECWLAGSTAHVKAMQRLDRLLACLPTARDL